MKKINFEEVFVPGIIDYNSRFVQAFKALINKDKGVLNSDNEVLLCLGDLSSAEKRQIRCGVYSDGPVHDYWTIYMKNSREYDFEYKTGLAIIELWKRSFREGRWNMQEDAKINKNLFNQLKNKQEA